jgi:hypothetical protein
MWRVEIMGVGRVERSSPMGLFAALRLARSQEAPANTQVQIVHVRRGWTFPVRWEWEG